jgi:hypothetical protein
MKRFLKVGLVAVMCFGVMSILSGCTNYERLATDAATGQFEQKGFAGEIDDSRADKIPTSVEGHVGFGPWRFNSSHPHHS